MPGIGVPGIVPELVVSPELVPKPWWAMRQGEEAQKHRRALLLRISVNQASDLIMPLVIALVSMRAALC